MEIESRLSERKIILGGDEISLSNYDIKHLREISGGEEFGDTEIEKAVRRVIEEHLEPFLRTAGIEQTEENLLKELKEGFHTHVFMFLHDHVKAE